MTHKKNMGPVLRSTCSTPSHREQTDVFAMPNNFEERQTGISLVLEVFLGWGFLTDRL